MVIVDYIIKWAVPFICGGVTSGTGMNRTIAIYGYVITAAEE